ncbi:MAG: flagellar export protein FliJ [Pseudomonadota bacterium]|nr:flagellar export protein FliJ [Pseudomonadota bacterium]
MTDLQPLTVLLARNERERDAAITAHQRAQAASRAARAQAEQLVTYRRDYAQRWRTQFRQEGAMELVHCYQSFMDRLTLAVEQQERTADFTEQEVARALAHLRAAELRCAAVQKLIERRLAEQRLATDRRDQKQTDEAASRAAWTRIGTTRPAPLGP